MFCVSEIDTVKYPKYKLPFSLRTVYKTWRFYFLKTLQNMATLTSLALDTESEGGDLAGLSDLVLIRSYN